MSSETVSCVAAPWRRVALLLCLLAAPAAAQTDEAAAAAEAEEAEAEARRRAAAAEAVEPTATEPVVAGERAEDEATTGADGPPSTAGEPGTPAAAEPYGPAPLAGPDEADSSRLGERDFVGAELKTGGGRDDSSGAVRPEAATDFYFARASLLLHERPSSRSAFTLAWEPEVERPVDGGDESVNHAVGVLLEQQATRSVRWLVGGSWLDGDDPSRFLGGLQFVLPITPYRQSRAYASLERQLDRTTVGVNLGWGATEMEAVEGVLRQVDQSEISGQLSLSRELGPRGSVSLGYAYVRPDAEGPFLTLDGENGDGEDGLEPPPPDPDGDGVDDLPLGLAPTPIHALTAGYRFRPGAGFEVQLAGGAARDGYDRTTGIGSLELVDRGERGSVRVRIDRSLVALGTQQSAGDPSSAEPVLSGGLLGDSVETALTLGIHRKLADWLWWEQLFWGARTSLAGDQTLESLAATARLVFRTPWRFGFFAEADWFDQRTTAGADSDGTSRLRWAIGLRADAGGPPGTRGFEIQRERLLRVLPDRGGE
jgi:hypothetical protein